MPKRNQSSPEDRYEWTYGRKSYNRGEGYRGYYTKERDNTLYEYLGVGRRASKGAIKDAYRRMSRTLHPDRGGRTEDFQELRNVYDILSDPDGRAVYDMYGIPGVQHWSEYGSDSVRNYFGPFGLDDLSSGDEIYSSERSGEQKFSLSPEEFVYADADVVPVPPAQWYAGFGSAQSQSRASPVMSMRSHQGDMKSSQEIEYEELGKIVTEMCRQAKYLNRTKPRSIFEGLSFGNSRRYFADQHSDTVSTKLKKIKKCIQELCAIYDEALQ